MFNSVENYTEYHRKKWFPSTIKQSQGWTPNNLKLYKIQETTIPGYSEKCCIIYGTYCFTGKLPLTTPASFQVIYISIHPLIQIIKFKLCVLYNNHKHPAKSSKSHRYRKRIPNKNKSHFPEILSLSKEVLGIFGESDLEEIENTAFDWKWMNTHTQTHTLPTHFAMLLLK